MKKWSIVIVVAIAAWWTFGAAVSVWQSNKSISEMIIEKNSEQFDEIIYLGSSLSFTKTLLNQDHDFVLGFGLGSSSSLFLGSS